MHSLSMAQTLNHSSWVDASIGDRRGSIGDRRGSIGIGVSQRIDGGSSVLSIAILLLRSSANVVYK